MGVSIRKLRAAVVVFRPLLEPHASRQFDMVLRRLGHVLSNTRDWDVFCHETLPAAETDLEESGWSGLLAHAARQERHTSYGALRTELAGAALTATVLGIAAWAEDEGALGDDTLGQPFRLSAPGLMDRLAHKAARRGRNLRSPTPQDLHSLRKMLK